MQNTKNKTELSVITLVFAVMLIIGICVYDDYGISTDEAYQRNHSIVTYRWLNRTFFNRGVLINEGTEDLMHYGSRYYGVAIQLPLVFSEDVYQVLRHEPMPQGTVYHMRHLYTYFIYVFALFCFYLMLKDIFQTWISGIAGVLMIYSFGRFFAHSFYNIKDLMFTSLFMISMFCAVRALKTDYAAKWCLLFAVSSAFTVSSRLVGALLPAALLLVILIDHIIHRKPLPVKALLLICAAYPIWLLITPASWTDPINFSLRYMRKFSDYKDSMTHTPMFEGTTVRKENLPWNYILQWIGITVPLVYLVFSALGLIFFGFRITRKTERESMDPLCSRIMMIVLMIFAAAILYQIIKRPAVYHDWRHLFFLYPLIIVYAVFGFHTLFYGNLPAVKWTSAAVLTLSLVYNFFLIIQNHPAEYMSYNPIGQQVGDQYEGDYYGLSIFQQLMWIVDNNTEQKSVTAYGNNRWRLKKDYWMLSDAQREQVVIPSVDTDYIIFWHQRGTNFPEIEGYEEVYPVISYGVKISALYQKKD